jgi:ubiquitin fusion degradation protein 1
MRVQSYIVSDLNKKPDLDLGGRVILPESLLEEAELGNWELPKVILCTVQGNNSCVTHCGVLEFTADHNCIVMPTWMTLKLELLTGDAVVVSIVNLPKAKEITFKPNTNHFLELDR